MKTDVMTIAVVVFALGVLASSVNATYVFKSESHAPTALQQGIAIR